MKTQNFMLDFIVVLNLFIVFNIMYEKGNVIGQWLFGLSTIGFVILGLLEMFRVKEVKKNAKGRTRA